MEKHVSKEKFFEFDLSNWPIVIVKFNKLNNNEEFNYFLKRWENLSKAKQNYSIILDTRNMSNIGITNAYSGANFVSTLRKHNPQYLKNVIRIELIKTYHKKNQYAISHDQENILKKVFYHKKFQ